MEARTVPFATLSAAQIEDAATILMEALAHMPSAWHDMPSAQAEVNSFVGDPERRAFAALAGHQLVGWIGAIDSHSHGWELHPLVVAPAFQRMGHGTRLIEVLESEAGKAGVDTVWLGTDDDFRGTTLYGADLFPDVLAHLSELAPTSGHPFTFYRDKGYAVVGALPDVNGRGKHDILMAKRIAAP